MIDIDQLSKVSSIGLKNGHIVHTTKNSLIKRSNAPSTFVVECAYIKVNGETISSEVSVYVNHDDVSWIIGTSKNLKP